MFLCKVYLCLHVGPILGSVLGSFWEPSAPLYSFWDTVVINFTICFADFFEGQFQVLLWRPKGQNRACDNSETDLCRP